MLEWEGMDDIQIRSLITYWDQKREDSFFLTGHLVQAFYKGEGIRKVLPSQRENSRESNPSAGKIAYKIKGGGVQIRETTTKRDWKGESYI